MSGTDNRPAGPVTVTHARIRVEQGDLAGARRLLHEILLLDPDDLEARGLLETLPAGDGRSRAEREEPLPPPAVAATAEELGASFRATLGGPDPRVVRLKSWLGRITSRRGGDGAE